MRRSWEEERFLDNVWLIQRRAVKTAALITILSVGVAMWVWWRTATVTWGALALQPTTTPHEARLGAQLLKVVGWLTVSLRLFVVETVVVAVGVLVLLISYGREIDRLLDMAERLPPAEELPPPPKG